MKFALLPVLSTGRTAEEGFTNNDNVQPCITTCGRPIGFGVNAVPGSIEIGDYCPAHRFRIDWVLSGGILHLDRDGMDRREIGWGRRWRPRPGAASESQDCQYASDAEQLLFPHAVDST